MNDITGQSYEVERILDHRERDGITEYHVKWKSYPVEYNTWEPRESFNDGAILANYWRNHAKTRERQ